MDVAVGSRIDLLIIDAIQDAKEAVTARAQQVIELLAEGWRQDLLCIALAHRRNRIGEEDTTRHNIDNIRQFGDLRVEEAIGRHARYLQNSIAKDPLIG